MTLKFEKLVDIKYLHDYDQGTYGCCHLYGGITSYQYVYCSTLKSDLKVDVHNSIYNFYNVHDGNASIEELSNKNGIDLNLSDENYKDKMGCDPTYDLVKLCSGVIPSTGVEREIGRLNVQNFSSVYNKCTYVPSTCMIIDDSAEKSLQFAESLIDRKIPVVVGICGQLYYYTISSTPIDDVCTVYDFVYDIDREDLKPANHCVLLIGYTKESNISIVEDGKTIVKKGEHLFLFKDVKTSARNYFIGRKDDFFIKFYYSIQSLHDISQFVNIQLDCVGRLGVYEDGITPKYYCTHYQSNYNISMKVKNISVGLAYSAIVN